MGAFPPPKNPHPFRAAHRRSPGRRNPGQSQRSRAFEKELALLGKEETEARQINLLLVHLYLGKVGVEGEVRRQILRNPVLDIESDIAVAGVPLRGVAARSVLRPPIPYGLISRFLLPRAARARRAVAASETRKNPGRPRPCRDRQRRQVVPLVLAPHIAPAAAPPTPGRARR